MNRIVRSILLFAIGAAIFIGLPLVAWGVGDIGGFFAHPARAGYALLTLLMQVVIVARMPEAGGARGAPVPLYDVCYTMIVATLV